jgi:hypothetical protein
MVNKIRLDGSGVTEGVDPVTASTARVGPAPFAAEEVDEPETTVPPPAAGNVPVLDETVVIVWFSPCWPWLPPLATGNTETAPELVEAPGTGVEASDVPLGDEGDDDDDEVVRRLPIPLAKKTSPYIPAPPPWNGLPRWDMNWAWSAEILHEGKCATCNVASS